MSSPDPCSTDRPLAERLGGINLYLVGMMGAGKSAVGRPLADGLGYRFIDADRVLEQTAAQTIPELFETEGEQGFRDLESAVLARIASWHSLVVATGGGVVLRSENWGRLQQGLVVWLDAPESVLLERLRSDPTPRPLISGPDPAERLRVLLEQRRPLYGLADLQIQQDGRPPADVAKQVLMALPGVLNGR
ncbi:shikimate kinase [Synechococcus sp. CS-1325]|uniref:shikimate kinase n=1 Tax=unclassified Synechococcus TaxID=2626047 RepID=UPI000DAFDEAC|nr:MULTISPECIES: shikimate kinase [unclassified Synechococcus]PZU99013.1 MAG: shikimate kinase [Cyanobium sp.]MCT0199947.1 shikimate kinase [Synechococcus sp. CS-1325]MCT0212188.1 shikimate kinase [Synechococcus sp. CS-1326]MCT0230453.1 shikimate kinase [Synechococcus sp. CS-1324]MCT0233385.1 shikimate kinase [Synechococcus sp. CS-1327]